MDQKFPDMKIPGEVMNEWEQQSSEMTPEEFQEQLKEFTQDMPAAGSMEMFFHQMQEAFDVNQVYDEKEKMFLEASRSLEEDDFDDDDFYSELSDLLDGRIER